MECNNEGQSIIKGVPFKKEKKVDVKVEVPKEEIKIIAPSKVAKKK